MDRPEPPANQADLGPAEGETLDRLVGDWRILQLKRGHRFSTDDLVTAWRAHLAQPLAPSVLDLGSGIGAVGFSTLARLSPGSKLVGIEAQQESVDLARRTAELNGLSERVDFHHGDLRAHAQLLPVDERFDLITGSPPYIPLDRGVSSPVPQRAACRMELRGSVVDYCVAAAARLTPTGRFVFVMAANDVRTEAAPLQAGLVVLERTDAVFRAGRAPLIAVLVCGFPDQAIGPRVTSSLTVRDDCGEWTPEYLAFREGMRARPSMWPR